MAQNPEFDQIVWRYRDEINRETKRLFSEHSSKIANSVSENDTDAALTELREEIEEKVSKLADKLLDLVQEEHKSASDWKNE